MPQAPARRRRTSREAISGERVSVECPSPYVALDLSTSTVRVCTATVAVPFGLLLTPLEFGFAPTAKPGVPSVSSVTVPSLPHCSLAAAASTGTYPWTDGGRDFHVSFAFKGSPAAASHSMRATFVVAGLPETWTWT